VQPTRPTKVTDPKIEAERFAALRANVDELGALEREFAPLKFKIERIDALRRSIREFYANEPAENLFIASGDHFAVSVGAKSREAVVDMPRLRKLIGVRLFNLVATVTQKKLAEEVPGSIAAEVTSFTFTGFRALKVFEKGATA
jgi:hypothetical protein